MSGFGSVELNIGRTVRATAPVRICDVGGWTDTWFGSPGQVCSLAVGPGVTVEATLVPGAGRPAPIRLRAADLGLDLGLWPDGDDWAATQAGDHPLLIHAVAAVLESAPLPDGVGLDLRISSAVPPGASLGTSASVLVALLGALDGLVAGGRRTPAELAVLAHEVETERAGRQAGVQDGWAAALGGPLDLRIAPYPQVDARPVALPAGTVEALGDRLVTVVFGPHDSSAVHQQVITAITGCGGADHDRARAALRRLSSLAGRAATALADGDLDRWGTVLVEATEAQAHLHPELVGASHRAAIDVARSAGAVAWKVNGAGGDGGSLTVLAGHALGAGTVLRSALRGADPTWQLIDLHPAPGLTLESRPA